MNCKGFGKKLSLVKMGTQTNPKFAWKDCRKPEAISRFSVSRYRFVPSTPEYECRELFI
jgi:hypothetical protein